MKGKRKRPKFKPGNQACLLSSKCMVTEKEFQDLSKCAPPTTSISTPSTSVSPSPNIDVLNSQSTDAVSPIQCDLPCNESVWLPRLDENKFKLYAKQSFDGTMYTNPTSHESQRHVKLLRPLKISEECLDEYLDDDCVENRVLNRDLTISMINRLNMSHSSESPTCNEPYFEIVDEKQWGLGWCWQLKCSKCKFVSESYKLYKEIDKCTAGRKAGAINYGFQTGVMNTSIGNNDARLILTSAGIPPISTTGMQGIANKVSDKIVDLAEQDTKRVVENLQERNLNLGLNKNHPIKVQMDGTYQSVTIKSRNKMGQNTSQAIGIACENETDDHSVISYHFLNKLCWVGSWLRNQGYDDIKCPDHVNCTANIDSYESLSEKKLGYNIGMKIGKQDLLVDYCTTDGDSSSVAGLRDAMQELFGPLWSVNRQADTIHRGQSQFRQGLKAKFSENMFPGSTKAQKNEIQLAFSNDIKHRSYGIMKSLFAKYNGDKKLIAKCLPRIVKSVVNCYSGKCGDTCRWSVTLCRGGLKQSWWYKSISLSSHGLKNGSLNPTEKDKVLMSQLLEMKLSQSALEQMKFFGNTNKCEYVNRVISTCLPKNKTFSRNAPGRSAAGVLKVNFKPEVALVKSLKAVGCPISKNSRAHQELKKKRKRRLYDKAYKDDVRTKWRKLRARKKQATEFVEYRRQNKSKLKSGYRKHKLEPKISNVCDDAKYEPQPGCSFW